MVLLIPLPAAIIQQSSNNQGTSTKRVSLGRVLLKKLVTGKSQDGAPSCTLSAWAK